MTTEEMLLPEELIDRLNLAEIPLETLQTKNSDPDIKTPDRLTVAQASRVRLVALDEWVSEYMKTHPDARVFTNAGARRSTLVYDDETIHLEHHRRAAAFLLSGVP